MRILDESGTEIQVPDLTNGYLKEDSLFIAHHEAVEAVAEQGHYETVREYPGGGKDVIWVMDTPAVEAKEAYDEYEQILRYVPYTQQERGERRIRELKEHLFRTDYYILKAAEGALELDEISEIVAQRAAWRKEINEIEEALNA